MHIVLNTTKSTETISPVDFIPRTLTFPGCICNYAKVNMHPLLCGVSSRVSTVILDDLNHHKPILLDAEFAKTPEVFMSKLKHVKCE